MHEVLRATSDSQLFLVTTAPYVVLDTELRIRAANPAYLRVTGRTRDDLIGAFVFDAFPDNPEDPTAIGVLTAARGISTDDAAVWLRTTAASRRLPRADIARTVLARYGV
ncbi:MULTISPECIES: ANTAR domain-containing protein [Streptomyces]|uniref:PAS fold protein n=1 Tax=Streptomyces rimosus subsp. rimosus TaxID=132474 RepID=A0ABY3ZBJ1_STRRM|nr:MULTISPECIES: PAS domain-containing protein [Streptomyces]KOG69562.1 hypothetical protein ADK78_32730 [Kitasatospora aureofaciens]KEF08512.1 hypothetical protein DF17_05280 [Streptomyces rimosus]KEF20773.1 hypothetical protein DF18_10260 [Streptomyces rimosus]KOT26432.1 hypothetical protein ADK84_40780 [Streptomyces sp. NRRL WC-3701]KOT26676.1 hypothetical protein ADK42_38040 [Streptomyces rimosus subsp. rimosus]